ncbi:MAG: hypothetical protein EBS23_01030 [Betaproteobacteria bacterium]|jgi:hypothetical protein|nr:hypothetical protein [Betaproteobacteria bacterium]
MALWNTGITLALAALLAAPGMARAVSITCVSDSNETWLIDFDQGKTDNAGRINTGGAWQPAQVSDRGILFRTKVGDDTLLYDINRTTGQMRVLKLNPNDPNKFSQAASAKCELTHRKF